MQPVYWIPHSDIALSCGEISFQRFSDILLVFRPFLSKNKTFPLSWKKIDFSKKFWEKTISKKIQLIYDKLDFPSIRWNCNFDGNNFSYLNNQIPHDGSSLIWVMVRHFEDNSNVRLTDKERLLFVICLRVLFHIPYSWFTKEITKDEIDFIGKSIDFSRNMCGEGDIIYTMLYYIKIQHLFELRIQFSYPQNYSSLENDSTPKQIQEDEQHSVFSIREILNEKELKNLTNSKNSVNIEMLDMCSEEELRSNLEKCKKTIERLQEVIDSSNEESVNEFTRIQISNFEEEISRISLKLSN